MKSPRGKWFWKFYEIPEGIVGLIDVWREHEQQRPHPQRRTHYTTVQTKRTLYFVVFVLVPVCSTTFCLLYIFCFERVERAF